MKKIFNFKVSLWFLIPLSILSGFAFTLILKTKKTTSVEHQNIQPHSSLYPFLNPTLGCVGELYELKPFKDKIETIVNRHLNAGTAKNISIYFRCMNNGYQFGINSKDLFYPASLLKVPVMMSYLKIAIDSPELFDKKIKFEHPFTGVPLNDVKGKIELGKEYTIKELIEKMVVVSDNDATILLNNNINPKIYQETLKEIGLEVPEYATPDANFIRVVDYTRVLRILYNSSYLNRVMSNYALELLSKAQYKDGIAKGAEGNSVAHKFGEWFYNGMYQLHDCGIVYDARQPYSLGIMTRGAEFKNLENIIKEISKAVAENVNTNIPDRVD